MKAFSRSEIRTRSDTHCSPDRKVEFMNTKSYSIPPDCHRRLDQKVVVTREPSNEEATELLDIQNHDPMHVRQFGQDDNPCE